MLLSLFARRAAICFCWGLFLGIPTAVFGQTNYYTNQRNRIRDRRFVAGRSGFSRRGGEIRRRLCGVAGQHHGWRGWGVSAMQLSGGTLSGSGSSFRVNVQGTNDQANARVALLQNGGAVFVWQGGKPIQEHIYARFLLPPYLADGDDVLSARVNHQRIRIIVYHQHNLDGYNESDSWANNRLYYQHNHDGQHDGHHEHDCQHRIFKSTRRRHADQRQRRDCLGQFQSSRPQQFAGCLWPDPFAGRRENWRRIFNQSIYHLQSAHAGSGGAGQRRIRRCLGVRAGTRGRRA